MINYFLSVKERELESKECLKMECELMNYW